MRSRVVRRSPSADASPARSPRDFAGARAPVGDAREHEQQVGEPVQVDDHDLRHRDVRVAARSAITRALGAAAHRARDVQRGRLRRAARQDERLAAARAPPRRRRSPARAAAMRVSSRRAFSSCSLVPCSGCGVASSAPMREQVALDRREHLVDARHHLDGARDADHRVELVDVAVRFDARRGPWGRGRRRRGRCRPSSPVLV